MVVGLNRLSRSASLKRLSLSLLNISLPCNQSYISHFCVLHYNSFIKILISVVERLCLELSESLESKITKLVIKQALEDWLSLNPSDVVIVGAGPSGLTAAKYIAEKGLKVVVFDRRLSFGGGIGGGSMLFHKLVIEEEAQDILRDFDIRYSKGEDTLYVVDAAEFMAKLAAGAIEAGAKILLGITVDDVIYRENPLRITGVAIQWSAVIMSQLHVDPLLISSKAVVDATGHDAEILSIVSRKIPEFNLIVSGEKSVFVELSEKEVVQRTGRVVPGLYVTGMAVAQPYNLPRMGPIFGGMLLSGRKVAEAIIEDIAFSEKAATVAKENGNKSDPAKQNLNITLEVL